MTNPITPGPGPGQLILPRASAAAAPALQPGRIVSAMVREGPDGALMARLAQLSLPLPRGADLAAGEMVHFRVTSSRDGLVLNLLAERPSNPTAQAAAGQPLQLRDLPRQLSAAEALRGLPSLARAPTGEGSAATLPGLPAPAREALAGLLARLPTVTQATNPEGLRQALRDSGTLFEPLLLRLTPDQVGPLVQRDLKALLTGAATRIRNAGPTAPTAAGETPGQQAPSAQNPTPLLVQDPARALEGLVARINLLQASSQAGEGRVDLAFEIPLRQDEDVDALELRLKEDEGAADADESDSGWQVDLRLRFADDDAVEARVRLDAGERVTVTWRAQSEDTATRLRTALPELEQALERAGLTVAHLGLRGGAVDSRHPALERVSRPGSAFHEKA